MREAKSQRQDTTNSHKTSKDEIHKAEQDDDNTDLEQQRSEFAELLAKRPPPPREQTPSANTMSTAATRTGNFSVDPSNKKPKVKAKDLKKKKKASIAAKNAEKRKSKENVTHYRVSNGKTIFHRLTCMIPITSIEIKQELESSRHPLQEGDTAKRIDFETLISLETSRALGPMEAAKLVPWVPPYLSDYMIVLADPRQQSGDLRQAMAYLASNMKVDVLQNIVVITPDSSEEWTK
jgi:hypothetical protein